MPLYNVRVRREITTTEYQDFEFEAPNEDKAMGLALEAAGMDGLAGGGWEKSDNEAEWADRAEGVVKLAHARKTIAAFNAAENAASERNR